MASGYKADRVEWKVDCGGLFESLTEVKGFHTQTGRRAYEYRRFGFVVTRFMATPSQIKKIRAGKGTIQITQDQIQYYKHLDSSYGK